MNLTHPANATNPGNPGNPGTPGNAVAPANPASETAQTSPKLADFLCFAISSANLAFGKAYKPILEELGLTYTQYITIIALWEEDNQTVSGLGERITLANDRGTIELVRAR